ncbi:hypothetical protein [Tissierella praeacuta]|uniref:hypothetical protein n=1 Tax=Tissierella praeacuta TaxID=43131 RepID=UPI003DA24143
MFIKMQKIKKNNNIFYLKSIRKSVKATILTIFLFISGIVFTSIGLIKGKDIALILSRPNEVNFWSTSNEMILGCTYIPILIGISFVILSLLFSAILFKIWMKLDEDF